jgi:hypothetical protein
MANPWTHFSTCKDGQRGMFLLMVLIWEDILLSLKFKKFILKQKEERKREEKEKRKRREEDTD